MSELPLGQTGILGIAILFGIFQGLFLAGIFWTRRTGDGVSNRLVGTVLFVMSAHLCEIFLLLSGLVVHAPFMSGLTFPLLYLVGPLFYLYGRRLLIPGHRLRWIHLLHALPWAYMLWESIPWVLAPAEVKAHYHLLYQTREVPQPPTVFLIKLGFNVLQHMVYVLLTLRLIRRREADARSVSANNVVIDGIMAFRNVTTGFAAYTGLYFLFFVALTTWEGYGVTIDSIWLVILAFMVQAIGYVAITRPETFAHSIWDAAEEAREVEGGGVGGEASGMQGDGMASEALEAARESSEPTAAEDKYQRSSLSKEHAQKIRDDLVEHMRTRRPYLDGELKLRAIAAQMGVNSHHLSQVINQETGQNFFDFVNQYRVEQAKRLLQDPAYREETVLTIGFESGFNSKASFNMAFRKFVQTTPTAYRKAS